jgi:hypothetical protein
MAEKSPKIPYFVQPEKKDILDIMDTYRYMNSPLISELFTEGIWDYGSGWVQMNYSSWEWRNRLSTELPTPYPEAPHY